MIIQADHIYKSYGKAKSTFQALNDVNLAVEAGESIAITGKSGSGKSTLMHLLALLDRPTSGEIIVGGRKSSSLKREQLDRFRNRDFGFVFQQFFLNAHESVLSNVILPLKIAGVPAKERTRRGMEVLQAVELEDKAANNASDLSGGQKQRVCIARALINNPKIIFADEPTGNLDSKTGQKIEDLLFKLNKEHDITLIVVTHDPDLAARCDRQVIMTDGKVAGERK
ncbi:MAG TPA: ABC transporter ATP-binding protein [Candidatus Saccharimonadales bacterium]|nr:ABC transporter ATP-binding protein [Candidatus Saccharimonadales bacterium]